jgi:hypothetical protein
MNREEFEDRYGSLRDEGFTPEECGIRRRRHRWVEDEEPMNENDFTYHDDGSMVRFTIQNDRTQRWVERELGLQGWQWLGKRDFAVESHIAPRLIVQLREIEGFTLKEVK